ncbi:MAG TPA: ABC transporter permease [Myxococcales bacterium]|nr:ABC transporter permease [Myxococcales bacterium]
MSAWVDAKTEGELQVLYLKGDWRLPQVVSIRDALRDLPPAPAQRRIVDGTQLHSLDTAGGLVLSRYLAEAGCPDPASSGRGLAPGHRRLLALVQERMSAPPEIVRSKRPGFVNRIGASMFELRVVVKRHVGFVGKLAVELASLVRRPQRFRPKETTAQFQAACLEAVPIIALVNLLIGVVIAYVLGVEAARYGAGLFVADGIALGVCRELSPILSSVLVAGRSGAAFTAQIGTMKVEEEIDAIRTLGLSPIHVLVIPRLAALVVGLPLLVFVGDAAGVLGGMAVGRTLLGIPPDVFVARVHGALQMRHFIIGLAKAPVFAAVIAVIGCRMGLEVARDARSAGQSTTSTVVQCIVAVILLDAAFAIALQQVGI